ncbi:MAG TPA: helix-turn-helix domain-containing protein [Vicinamibacteria bacterium]|nr:helix-turn-helix domain-containing protein [Vicinamibacteria bacterium]
MPAQSHYEVLGISAQASPEEVERAYRFTLELYGDGALATYSLLDPAEVRRARARVQEAYEALRDPARRQAYDQSHGLASGSPPRPLPANVRAWPQPVTRPADAIAASGPSEGAAAATGGHAAAGQATAPAMVHDPIRLSGPAEPPPSPAEAPRSASAALPAPGASAARAAGASAPFGRTPHLLPEPVTGAVLRRYREERGVSLRDIANQSKIGTRYLEYIEGDRLDMLPAAVYLRGFLQEYARSLGLDPRLTANAYMAQLPRPWPQE